MRSVQRPARQDDMSEMLRTLRVSTTVFCRSDMGAPWGFAVKAHGRAAFHILLEGGCWLEADGAPSAMRLEQGDIAVLPRGPEHRLRSEPSAPVEWLDEILERTPPTGGRLAYGGKGARTDLICGVFAIEDREAAPVLSSLPTIAVVRRSEASDRWLAPLLQLIKTEIGSFAPGADSVVARLADVLLLQVLRHSMEASDGHPLDVRVGKALRLMREQPERRWTVDSLAGAASASRTALVDHFRASTGVPPMRYLTRLRIAMAARELSGSDSSLAAIAARTGYSSEVALSKAFTREMRISPRDYRTRARSTVARQRPARSVRRRRSAA